MKKRRWAVRLAIYAASVVAALPLAMLPLLLSRAIDLSDGIPLWASVIAITALIMVLLLLVIMLQSWIDKWQSGRSGSEAGGSNPLPAEPPMAPNRR